MWRLICIVIVVILTVATTAALPVVREPDTTTILADIEQQIARALLNGERDTYSAFLSPDWSVIDIAGRVRTKEQVVNDVFVSGEQTLERLTVDEITVRTFGELAVVTGRTSATGSTRGTRVSVVLRFTDVFVHRDGRWLVVASQGTPVTP